MVLTGRVCMALTAVACVPAAPAVATRPGSIERQLASISDSHAGGLAVGPGGRMVIVGSTYGDPQRWIRAYLPDGRPDPSFGSDGVRELAEPQRALVDVVIQPDGRILLAFSGWNGIMRLNPDGSPDEGFGDGGLEDLGVGSRVSDIALQPDGKIVVVQVGSEGISVFRLHSDGSSDGGFGQRLSPVGEATGASLAIPPTGGLLVTVVHGRTGQARIARISPGGGLDGSFGSGGFAPVQLGRRDWAANTRFAGGSALTRDGRIRLPAAFRESSEDPYRMAVVGLTADGHPDRGFGDRGLAVAPRRATRGGLSAGAALADSRGAVVVSGRPMRRFHADGAYDRSFAGPDLRGNQITGLAFLDTDTLVVSTSVFGGKYPVFGPAALWTVHAGHDPKAPSLRVVARGCDSIRVRARDAIGVDRVTVRAGGRVVRRTRRTRFDVRLRRGVRRVSVVATDLAGNSSSERVRLPRC